MVIANRSAIFGKRKSGGSTPIDRIGLTVQRNRPADDAAIGAESPPPQCIVQHDNTIAADFVLFGQKHAAELGA